jgi:predicted AAA+ superfamily ATPase
VPHVYRHRLIDPLVTEILDELPAVMVVGPRGSGKTTSARRQARSMARLDLPDVAGAFRADPDGALRSYDEPLLIDEWQLVPDVLPAIKRAIDDGSGSRRFLITGSVRAELLEATWAATGRVIRIEQWGLCQRELEGDPTAASLFDRIRHDGIDGLPSRTNPPDTRGYVELALRGSFPEVALTSSPQMRQRWLAGYVDQLVLRDALLVGEHRDPVRLRRYLAAIAANNAGVVNHKTIYDAAGVTRDTALRYDSLLELLFVTERLPAWHSSRLRRLVTTPKRYVTDPGLCGPLLGIDARAVVRSNDLLGRIIDSFVVSQLRPELVTATHRPTLYHLRRDDGSREIDLIVEWPDGAVLGVEIKAATSVSPPDARNLSWLRRELGDRFIGGLVLHTGSLAFTVTEGVRALPIATLWSSPHGDLGDPR